MTTREVLFNDLKNIAEDISGLANIIQNDGVSYAHDDIILWVIEAQNTEKVFEATINKIKDFLIDNALKKGINGTEY